MEHVESKEDYRVGEQMWLFPEYREPQMRHYCWAVDTRGVPNGDGGWVYYPQSTREGTLISWI